MPGCFGNNNYKKLNGSCSEEDPEGFLTPLNPSQQDPDLSPLTLALATASPRISPTATMNWLPATLTFLMSLYSGTVFVKSALGTPEVGYAGIFFDGTEKQGPAVNVFAALFYNTSLNQYFTWLVERVAINMATCSPELNALNKEHQPGLRPLLHSYTAVTVLASSIAAAALYVGLGMDQPMVGWMGGWVANLYYIPFTLLHIEMSRLMMNFINNYILGDLLNTGAVLTGLDQNLLLTDVWRAQVAEKKVTDLKDAIIKNARSFLNKNHELITSEKPFPCDGKEPIIAGFKQYLVDIKAKKLTPQQASDFTKTLLKAHRYMADRVLEAIDTGEKTFWQKHGDFIAESLTFSLGMIVAGLLAVTFIGYFADLMSTNVPLFLAIPSIDISIVFCLFMGPDFIRDFVDIIKSFWSPRPDSSFVFWHAQTRWIYNSLSILLFAGSGFSVNPTVNLTKDSFGGRPDWFYTAVGAFTMPFNGFSVPPVLRMGGLVTLLSMYFCGGYEHAVAKHAAVEAGIGKLDEVFSYQICGLVLKDIFQSEQYSLFFNAAELNPLKAADDPKAVKRELNISSFNDNAIKVSAMAIKAALFTMLAETLPNYSLSSRFLYYGIPAIVDSAMTTYLLWHNSKEAARQTTCAEVVESIFWMLTPSIVGGAIVDFGLHVAFEIISGQEPNLITVGASMIMGAVASTLTTNSIFNQCNKPLVHNDRNQSYVQLTPGGEREVVM